jgi:Metallo-peptidase family M12B Reprolysin-like
VWAVTCVNPNVNGATSAWVKGATIAVTVSGFSSTLQPCIKTAFDNWNSASATNGSNVTFVVSYGAAIDPTGKNNVYQVTQATTKDANGYPLAGQTGGQTNGANRINANSTVDPNITNCTAATQTMAHEIGHTLGFGECSQCTAPQQSVMIAGRCG